MIEWTIFYRALGIPDNVLKPTFYQLLDLDPRSCTPERVEEKRNQQRIRLRQSIPGPQFIPLVLRFEKHKLDHAASVLRDPAQRERYDLYLTQKAEKHRRQAEKDELRQVLVKKIRAELDRYLNRDKTLDDTNRPLLAASLRKLGVKPGDINELLDRIPGPARPAAGPSEEVMRYFAKFVELAIQGHAGAEEARKWTLGMANTLGISSSQAGRIFDRALRTRRVPVSSEPVGDEAPGPYALAEPIAYAPPPLQTESSLEGSWSEVAPADDESIGLSGFAPWQKILLVVLPVLVLGIFTLIAWRLWRGDTRPPPQVTQKIEPNVIDATNDDANVSQEGSREFAGTTPPSADANSPPAVPPALCYTPEQLRRTFAGGNARNEEILSDVVLALCLCRARAIQYTSQSAPSDDWIQPILDSPESLMDNVHIGSWTPNVKTSPAVPNNLTKAGIKRLMDLDTAEAAEELLRRLSERVGKASIRGPGAEVGQSVARHLFALSQMHDPNVPARLADMIEKSSSLAAFMLVQTLTEITGLQTPPQYLLPLSNDSQQRAQCAGWWKRNVPKTGRQRNLPRSGRITGPGPSSSPGPSAATPVAWQPDAEVLKRLALAAHLAHEMAAVLEQSSPGDPNALLQGIATPPPIQVTEPNQVAADLLTALQGVREAVLRRIDTKGASATQASTIERRRWVRSAASVRALQEAVVEMDAVTDFLYLLICSSGKSPQVIAALEAVLAERNKAVGSADAVDKQLRESCYYSFVLWDALVKP